MEKLKVGILISSSKEIAAWELETVKQLQKASFVCNIVFIVYGKFQLKTSNNNWAYQLFKNFENRWFKSEYIASIKNPVSSAYKYLKLTSIEDDLTKEAKEEIDLIKNESIDIIYCANNNLPGDKFSNLAKFGLWSISFGNKQYRNSKPEGFWEVMNDEPATGSSLDVSYKKKLFTVYDCTTQTIPYSVLNNFNSMAWRSSSFLYYRLRELYLLGEKMFFSKYQLLSITSSKEITPPSNGRLIFLIARNIYRYLIYKLNEKKNQKRFTLLHKNEGFTLEDSEIKNFVSLPLPTDTFWADPFVIKEDGRSLIFFEEFKTTNNKAHISLIAIDKTEKPSKPQTVLEKNYHLSYPFVFKFNDEYYMLPETSANKTVELYKATSFPGKWELAQTLINNIIFIDPTLFFKDGTWWLFGTTQTHPFTSTNDQLMLYYSKDLLSSDWNSHPQNPVATDISNCRPAGKIFEKDGKYYRPAQNNASKQYGYAITINEIKILNEHTYKEEKILEISPSKENGLLAVHTLNFSDEITIIDGIVRKKPKSKSKDQKSVHL
jgi:hypothetical protein